MQLLRRKSIIMGLFSVIELGICSWLAYRESFALLYLAIILTLLTLICFYQQQQKLKTARLIVENAIFTTASSIMAGYNRDQASKLLPDTKSVEMIVSCFGVLSGEEVYKFNCDGIHLFSVEINSEDMLFTFGTDEWTKYLRFGHNVSSPDQIQEIAEKLRYETGISRIIGTGGQVCCPPVPPFIGVFSYFA
ncbi:hypothetical protein [Syntrophomonas erecta]